MINETAFVSDIDGEKFSENIRQSISLMQQDGLEVEIQYQCTTLTKGQDDEAVVFSALILGRKKGE